jgi:hypothetical protein
VGSLCFETVSAAEKRASIWRDHPIKYCGRRCNWRAHARSTAHPTERILCESLKMHVRGLGRRTGLPAEAKTLPTKAKILPNDAKILGHHVKFRRCGSPSPPAEHLLGHPERPLSGMSHNRRPMSMTPANNPNPIRRMADHGWHAPLHVERVSSGRPYWGTGIANGCGNARYLGFCRAAVAYGLPKRR